MRPRRPSAGSTCVGAQVPLEGSVAGEGAVALAADVAAHPCVHLHVLLQGRLRLEALAAEQAEHSHVRTCKRGDSILRHRLGTPVAEVLPPQGAAGTPFASVPTNAMHQSWRWQHSKSHLHLFHCSALAFTPKDTREASHPTTGSLAGSRALCTREGIGPGAHPAPLQARGPAPNG